MNLIFQKGLGLLNLLLLLGALSAVLLAAEGRTVHWSYEGRTGPAHWGDLSPENAQCKIGNNQSPIDIGNTIKSDLQSIGFHYTPSAVKVINNGHTIQVNLARGGTISLGDKSYTLQQFHFNAPSEHTINGTHSDMEVHLVHKSEDGQIAVLGVLMNLGAAQDVVRTIWDRISKTEGREVALDGIQVDANQLLPADRSYYYYMGSLTTPPCSEGVSWYLLKTPVEVSADQLTKFKGLFRDNARPVQPLNERVIKEW